MLCLFRDQVKLQLAVQKEHLPLSYEELFLLVSTQIHASSC